MFQYIINALRGVRRGQRQPLLVSQFSDVGQLDRRESEKVSGVDSVSLYRVPISH